MPINAETGPELKLEPDHYIRLLERIDVRREQRRSYEWKITLGLWAGLIVSSKFLAESADDLAGQITGTAANVVKGIVLLVGVLVVLGHAGYHLFFIRPAQEFDLGAAQSLEDKLGVRHDRDTRQAGGTNFGGWSSAFQITGTIALALLVETTAWVAFFAP